MNIFILAFSGFCLASISGTESEFALYHETFKYTDRSSQEAAK